MTGFITEEILKSDAERNGVLWMLMDAAEARKNGVAFTADAEDYLNRVIAEGVA